MVKQIFALQFIVIALLAWFGFKEKESLRNEIDALRASNERKALKQHTHFSHHTHNSNADIDHSHEEKHDHKFEYAKTYHEHPPHSHSYASYGHDHDEVEDMQIDVNYMKSQLIEIQYFVDTHRNVKHHRH